VAKHRASRRPTISIVGPGNLGTALAVTLSAAGYKVESIAVRLSKAPARAKALARRIGARLVLTGREELGGDIVWITVPDDAISSVAHTLARSGDWKGKTAFHSSGALASDELAALRERGARVASVHPMMTFVRGEVPQMRGVAFGLEGDAGAIRQAKTIIARLGGRAFVIEREKKVLYHVFGSFASPLIIAMLATMEQVGLAAGMRKQDIKPVMSPLLRQTLNNYMRRNAAAAFSGPLVRGDVATIRKHLAALGALAAPRDVYVAMARTAVEHLPLKNRQAIAKELARHKRTATAR
jgi:predicted short-subunit dehydrogenase-like oxidoreductase (DUF2520 family)